MSTAITGKVDTGTNAAAAEAAAAEPVEETTEAVETEEVSEESSDKSAYDLAREQNEAHKAQLAGLTTDSSAEGEEAPSSVAEASLSEDEYAADADLRNV